MSFKRSAIYAPNPATTRGVSTKLSASKEKIVYTNGKAVFIRDLDNPGLSVAYAGHLQNTTVARISPSGYYCASADISGTVRVWDTVGEDQVLKGEYKAISGRINDLEWDGESKRIIAVGDGKEKFGHAFMFDSGTSTGEIIGHSKAINAVAIRHQRPFRAATAADDSLIVFHQGAPYKYDKASAVFTIKTHTKFVQDVRFAASGDHFASVGSDGKIFVYDGKTGDTLGDFAEGHTGSIYAVSWSPDGKQISTASVDATVKLWDVETRKATSIYKLGEGVEHQQVGAVWNAPATIVSLSVSGDLNVFDPRTPARPAKTIYAPQKPVTAAAAASPGGTFFAGTADGRILAYDAGGDAACVAGGHTNLVSALAPAPGGSVFSAGYDDRVRELDGAAFAAAEFATAAQPRALAVAGDGTVFVAEAGVLEAVRANQKVAELKPAVAPSAVAAAGATVAVGFEDHKVRLYSWDGKALGEAGVLEGNKGTVSALAFSPDGALLAAGDSSGKIVLYDVKERKTVTTRWSFHTARVNALSWTADGAHCASGALDTHVYVWSVARPMKNIALRNAVPGGVSAVLWRGAHTLVGAGADAAVRVWDVAFHQSAL
ncbi:WD40 repeat-like protein [Artomyces pyxidatus]|uniref:WD40 repeat-like protein n=1 Tax=Artomyces pyxidatus TaxID=48021 RepID=A0ACB8TES8_9AGAM|nr:WD40 repeat-like protein [Artomyces pyxidatus]